MNAVVLTGSSGGIGRVIYHHLVQNGFYVIGIDKHFEEQSETNIEFNLASIQNIDERRKLAVKLAERLEGKTCVGLINNAAVQILGEFDDLDIESFNNSLNVNLVAPFVLSKLLLDDLRKNKGHIINIGSIHSSLTKQKFVAYSTSKTALRGFTKSLSVDIGEAVSVNLIEPAAIETPMLREGFEDTNDFNKLKGFHPTKSIGGPLDIAKLVLFIMQSDIKFLNGTIINLDGGISSRLHDPN